ADPATLTSALGITQQSLLAFQRMQEQTASLHKQFLDNQQSALATLQALVVQQQALLTGQPTSSVAVVPVRAAPFAAPAPVTPPPAVVPSPAVKVAPVAPTPASAPVIKSPAPAPKPPVPARDASGILLSVVAEKTGYPADMLGLDMALDADLGIDSIKRVEILSALQERIPDAPVVKPEHLGTLHTLRDIASFLGGPQVKNGPPIAPAKVDSRPSAITPGSVDNERVPEGRESPAVCQPATIVRSVIRPVPIDLTAARSRVPLVRNALVWVIADPSGFTARVT